MMDRSDIGRVLYAAGIAICVWMTYRIHAVGGNVGDAVPYIYLMTVTVASMVVLLIISIVHKSMADMARAPIVLTVASGPKKDMMRSRGIIGKMPPTR